MVCGERFAPPRQCCAPEAWKTLGPRGSQRCSPTTKRRQLPRVATPEAAGHSTQCEVWVKVGVASLARTRLRLHSARTRLRSAVLDREPKCSAHAQGVGARWQPAQVHMYRLCLCSLCLSLCLCLRCHVPFGVASRVSVCVARFPLLRGAVLHCQAWLTGCGFRCEVLSRGS